MDTEWEESKHTLACRSGWPRQAVLPLLSPAGPSLSFTLLGPLPLPQLFVSMLRGLGIQAKAVCSFQQKQLQAS